MKLAREKGATRIYLIEEVNGTRRWIKKPEYDALRALGWTLTTVPAGTLAVFTDVDAFKPFTAEELGAAITAAIKSAN